MKGNIETIKTEIKYDGHVQLRVDTLKLPSGEEYRYESVKPTDGVSLLPFIGRDTVLLSRQYRPPVQDTILELIQGGIEDGEHPVETAKRELLEETGYAAGSIEPLAQVYAMPGCLDHRSYLMVGHELEKIQEPSNDEVEAMDLVEISFRDLVNQVVAGKHKDGLLVQTVLLCLLNNGA